VDVASGDESWLAPLLLCLRCPPALPAQERLYRERRRLLLVTVPLEDSSSSENDAGDGEVSVENDEIEELRKDGSVFSPSIVDGSDAVSASHRRPPRRAAAAAASARIAAELSAVDVDATESAGATLSASFPAAAPSTVGDVKLPEHERLALSRKRVRRGDAPADLCPNAVTSVSWRLALHNC
jgi:hypothetical protein